MITPRQIKAARALLGWKQKQLADKCMLSLPVIAQAEVGNPVSSRTINSIRWSLENHGIKFIDRGVQLSD